DEQRAGRAGPIGRGLRRGRRGPERRAGRGTRRRPPDHRGGPERAEARPRTGLRRDARGQRRRQGRRRRPAGAHRGARRRRELRGDRQPRRHPAGISRHAPRRQDRGRGRRARDRDGVVAGLPAAARREIARRLALRLGRHGARRPAADRTLPRREAEARRARDAPLRAERGRGSVRRAPGRRRRPRGEHLLTAALGRGGASITLEPGAQLELSGEQCRTLHCTHDELTTHVRELVGVGGELGLAFLGLGMQPISRPEEIEIVPKQRYAIMAPYMERVGTLGVRMMKQTATVQANIDYADERDAMRKLRVGMGLAPILNAMFANSSLSEGDLNGYMSFRGHIWTDTDAARCGLLPLAFREGASFADYVAWALDVPLYF